MTGVLTGLTQRSCRNLDLTLETPLLAGRETCASSAASTAARAGRKTDRHR